ncbi:MAG: MFS transporter [Steroidobacteraceae bacterium]
MNPTPGAHGTFYGWKVLGALFMAGFMVYGGGLWSFVLFVVPLTEEFHWSRAATGGLVTAFWLSAPLILLGGYGIRRLGAVRMFIAGILLEAVCLAALATVSSFWQMYALRAVMGLGKVVFAVTLPYLVSRWFFRHYSFGLGITWAGWHFGGLVLAPITGAVIAAFGWRAACLTIAAGLVTVGLLPALRILRVRSPAELGMNLDGDAFDAAATLPAGSAAAVSTESAARSRGDDAPGSLSDLLGAGTFWFIALLTLVFYTTYSGLLTHQGAIVEGAGFSARLSSLVLGSTAGFAGCGSLITGWLLDRYSVRKVGIGMCALLLIGALSLLLVDRAHSGAGLVSYAACFGFTVGGGDLYFVALLRRQFPHVSVAFSYSAWYFCEILTLLVAGPVAGRIYDLTGNYAATLGILVCTASLALLASFGMARPRAAS